MSTVRTGTPGATRVCPHCREVILESASVCPACHKHLRFEARAPGRAPATFSPLRVERTIRHPVADDAWEYTMVLSIRNARGEEIDRKVVGVGALECEDTRTFTVAVEVVVPSTGKA